MVVKMLSPFALLSICCMAVPFCAPQQRRISIAGSGKNNSYGFALKAAAPCGREERLLHSETATRAAPPALTPFLEIGHPAKIRDAALSQAVAAEHGAIPADP